jgi:hypothetical protein
LNSESSENLVSGRDYTKLALVPSTSGANYTRTIQSSVIRFDMSLLHGTVFNNQSIALGAVTTEDGCAIEIEVECFGEGYAGVSEEADLGDSVSHVH